MKNETTAFPLCWPVGQSRTPAHKQGKSKFVGGHISKALMELKGEVRRLGGRDLIISSNVPVRQDGMPYADAARRRIDDPGVAVYFDLDGQPMCFACDRWWTPWENIHAIAKTIEALRGIERWGSSDMVERSFRGFTALPPPAVTEPPKRHWSSVLDVPVGASLEDIAAARNAMAKKYHPDAPGGSDDKMAEINAAYDQAKKEKAA